MWDLTGKTGNTDRFGDPTRWTPVPKYDKTSDKNYDTCKLRAQAIIQGAQAEDDKKSYWSNQGVSLMAPAILAASIRGESWMTALAWLLRWDDHTFTLVDEILFQAGEFAALRDWRAVRAMKLSRAPGSEFDWKEKATTASDTGGSIATSLNGLLLDITTQSAYDATTNPNFDPKDWIRSDRSAALFLIGNMREKGMTRSLLATLLQEILSEAMTCAMEYEDEKLPYRLVILADELPNLAPIVGIEEYLSTGRKHRIQIVLVGQSLGQFQKIYGRELTRTFLVTSQFTLIFSGMSDPELINDLGTIGGNKQISLDDDGHPILSSLIAGQHMTALRPPNSRTGRPGDAILITSGAVAMVQIPFWTLDHRYDSRGTVMPQFAETTEMLRAEARSNREKFVAFAKPKIEDLFKRVKKEPVPPILLLDARPIAPVARPFVPHIEDLHQSAYLPALEGSLDHLFEDNRN